MSRPARFVQGVVAGVIVMVVDAVPVLVVGRAGSSGSLGDLSDERLLAAALAFSVVLGIAAAALMVATLDRVDGSPTLGPFDAWGAFALGTGVYALAVTAVPLVILLMLLPDEDESLADRSLALLTVWLLGHLVAAGAGVWAGRRLLGHELRRAG